MNLSDFLLLVLLFTIYSCTGDDSTGSISYESLPDINAELVQSIGENESYIPGRFADMILTTDGSIVVRDNQTNTLEQFNAEGDHIGTIAHRGNGPGELPPRFTMIDGLNDTFVVIHQGSNQVDLFTQSSGGLFDHIKTMMPDESVQLPGRSLTFFGFRNGNELYALADSDYIPDREYYLNQDGYAVNSVVSFDTLFSVIQDSLHFVKIPRALLGDPGPNPAFIVLGRPPYMYHDRLIFRRNDRYLVARPDSSALFFYNQYHELEKRIQLNVERRPVTEADLDFYFKNEQRPDVRRELEEWTPEFKPPFLNLWVAEDRILLHTDNTEEGQELVAITAEGEPLGKFMLSARDEIRYFRNNRIYTIHRDPDQGYNVRVYHINF